MNIEELTKIHKVLGAGLVTSDGEVLESRITFDYDAKKLGTIASKVVYSTKKSLGVKRAAIIFYTLNSVFFAKETERGILFAICQKDANIGLVKVKIDKMTSSKNV